MLEGLNVIVQKACSCLVPSGISDTRFAKKMVAVKNEIIIWNPYKQIKRRVSGFAYKNQWDGVDCWK